MRVEDLALNEYENQVALEVVAPEDIPVGFDAIGGLEGIIEELKKTPILFLTLSSPYSHGGAGVLDGPGRSFLSVARGVARAVLVGGWRE